jgi:hypothetical protein
MTGGFVSASAFADDSGASWVCNWPLDVRGGWVSVAAQAFVCNRCMPDPGANGAGERMAARLVALREEETRRAREAWPLGGGGPPRPLSADEQDT